MFAIFGLGNYGTQYENTYHNMGFMVLDAFAKKHGLIFSKKKCSALFTEFNFGGKKVMLFKPQTYMNNSGISVIEAVNKFKIPTKNVLVVYDDLDIKVGDVRIRQNGSAGTHNGLKSIAHNLQNTDWPRIKIGIGAEYRDIIEYVLSRVSNEHKTLIEQAIEKAVMLIEEFIKQDGEVNRVHV